MSRRGPNYGKGVVQLEGDDGETPAELAARLRSVICAPTYRPPLLPAVALEVLRLSRQPEVTIPAVVDTLNQDPVLAGSVFKLARSPMYGGVSPPPTVKAAVVRLGLAAVRELVLEAAMNLRVFKAASYSDTLGLLRTHSVAVAHLARAISRHTPIDAEHAFLAGLVHDVGIAAGLLVLGEREPNVPLTPDRWWHLEAVHEELGAALIRQWQLPFELDPVVGGHHSLKVQGHFHPMNAVLAIAEHWVTEGGHGLAPAFPGEATEPGSSLELGAQARFSFAVEQLRLPPRVVQALEAEAQQLLTALNA